MTIFVIKMALSIASVFLSMDGKTVNAVINQLEQESKDEKDAGTKESFKIKKAIDEELLQFVFVPNLHTLTDQLPANTHTETFFDEHYPPVPTPPPNV